MNNPAAKAIGEKAYTALRREAWTTPKPGLVDRENSGAHRDMDYPLFLISCASLTEYFARCAAIGASHPRDGSQAGARRDIAYLEELRNAGLQGERSMFSATGDVNTHKGAVFSLGTLCASLGQLAEEQRLFPNRIDLQKLQKRCGETASALLAVAGPDDTHGAAVYKRGVGGIRKEAASGFSAAFTLGLPSLREAKAEGYDINQSMVKTLLLLMLHTQDSNVVYRGGLDGLIYVQKEAGRILRSQDLRTEQGMDEVRRFDKACIRRNLSPGGSADLLAFSVMLHLIFDEETAVEEERE